MVVYFLTSSSESVEWIMGRHKKNLPAHSGEYAWPLHLYCSAFGYKKLSLPYCIWPYHSERNAWNLDSMKKKRNRNISTRQLYVLCQSRGQISEQEMTVLSGRQTAAKRGEEDLLYSLKSSPWKTTTLWFGNWIDWA